MTSVHRAHPLEKGDAFMSLQTARPHGAQRTKPNLRQRGSRTPKLRPTPDGRSATSAISPPRAEFPCTGDRASGDSVGIC